MVRPLWVAAATAALLLLGTTILVSSPLPSQAHSMLYSPSPNHPADCTDPGKRQCLGHGDTACPPSKDPDGEGGSARRPAAVYARGQRVRMLYYKNNHAGVGFTRWSLVPAARYMSVKAHQRFAFHYNCWGSDYHKCTGKACGTDKTHHAWSALVTIPTSIPDGNYVLGWGTLVARHPTDSGEGSESLSPLGRCAPTSAENPMVPLIVFNPALLSNPALLLRLCR